MPGHHTAHVEPVAGEDEFSESAVAALKAEDWHGAYKWAKGWIGGGGGAWIVDPWLVYAVSALMHGQPRTAVHSLDLGLRHWIDAPEDRALLHYVRGTLIRRRLSDPKTARACLEAAVAHAPAWLRADAEQELAACRAEAAASRKRKPSVQRSPDYVGPGTVAGKVPGRQGVRSPGAPPRVWEAVWDVLAR